jgi:hypothetical protein
MAGMNLEQTATTSLPTGHDSHLPMPGRVIVKQFEGETLVVKVLADGLEFRDRRYRLLSAMAWDLNITQWNGFVFYLAGGGATGLAIAGFAPRLLGDPHGWGR